MSRAAAIQTAADWVETGQFFDDLAERIAIRSESPREGSEADQKAYLNLIEQRLATIGFDCRLLENPAAPHLPALFAERIEDPNLPTILIYGHGDVLWGMEGEWADELSPWQAKVSDGRLYGRGAVDNKGQHTINFKALEIVLHQRGGLGFNCKILLEMGEEAGSPGLNAIALTHKELLAADALIASDGPRVSAQKPTVFLGARGAADFSLRCKLREGAHHSGNWGGLLPNAGIRLAHALSIITDAQGKILVPEWRPKAIPDNVKAALAEITLEFNEGDPKISDLWGEPDLKGAAQVLGWCNFEVLAFLCGRPQAPVGAIPSEAIAHCQLRFVVGIDPDDIVPALRRHLDAQGFDDIDVIYDPSTLFRATRTDPDNPWTKLVVRSITTTLGQKPALCPNFGGALPNEVFAETLGMPTIWIPHSHPSCNQHAPNEHMLLSIAKEGAQVMAGLFWDLGAGLLKDE